MKKYLYIFMFLTTSSILIYGVAQAQQLSDEVLVSVSIVEPVVAIPVVQLPKEPRLRDEALKAQRSPTEREDEVLRQLQVMNNTLLRIEAKLK